MSTDQVWKFLFEEHELGKQLSQKGRAHVTARQIKKSPGSPEPRLTTKFDFRNRRPEILRRHGATILATANGRYELVKGDGYVTVPPPKGIRRFSSDTLPPLETLPIHMRLRSEAQAIDYAFLSSKLKTFLGDETLVLTVRGRLRSGQFTFKFGQHELNVDDVQVEVDGGYEGRSLYLVEAKFGPIEDLIIRQLYYPVRMWSRIVSKPVVPVLLVYTNKVFSLYRFRFTDLERYDSIALDGEPFHFSFDAPERVPSIADLIQQTRNLSFRPPPTTPFPQADDIRKVLTTIELYNSTVLNKFELAQVLNFDERQGDYYSNAASWLAFLKRQEHDFVLTADGDELLSKGPGARVAFVVRRLLSHPVFRQVAELRLREGTNPSKDVVSAIIRKYDRRLTGTTPARRAATVLSWADWMFSVQGTDYGMQ